MALSGAFPPSAALLLLALLSLLQQSSGRTFSFELHHKFSDQVREWVRSTTGVSVDWPETGSLDYYSTLLHHDRVLRGRNLAGSKSLVTFADGNMTLHLRLGFLHYAMVEMGTPGVKFLVALDTGSDLFWMPCQCIKCATPTASGIELSAYAPNMSTTSKYVPCNSGFCGAAGAQTKCSGTTNKCLYEVSYVSANTSSSGVLVEDVLHLTTEDSQPKAVSPSIVFGCGQVQTGSFLSGAAPNGLFGLGMEKISVPSILASSGLITDSFSMCFGLDGFGRINFGDKGSSDQGETPFIVNQLHPRYEVNISEIHVGISVIKISPGLLALFDTGTSFTYLADPLYTLIGDSFDKQVRDSRHTSDPTTLFDYCYDVSLNTTSILFPEINITMAGGDSFSVILPIVLLKSSVQNIYCLAITKSDGLNIIGQNFMKGHRIVFDREKGILGWKQFDCYKTDGASKLPVNPPAMSPTSPVPRSAFSPEDATTNGNKIQPPATSSGHARRSVFGCIFTTLMFILSPIFL